MQMMHQLIDRMFMLIVCQLFVSVRCRTDIAVLKIAVDASGRTVEYAARQQAAV
jgi:hypothetical protein